MSPTSISNEKRSTSWHYFRNISYWSRCHNCRHQETLQAVETGENGCTMGRCRPKESTCWSGSSSLSLSNAPTKQRVRRSLARRSTSSLPCRCHRMNPRPSPSPTKPCSGQDRSSVSRRFFPRRLSAGQPPGDRSPFPCVFCAPFPRRPIAQLQG